MTIKTLKRLLSIKLVHAQDALDNATNERDRVHWKAVVVTVAGILTTIEMGS